MFAFVPRAQRPAVRAARQAPSVAWLTCRSRGVPRAQQPDATTTRARTPSKGSDFVSGLVWPLVVLVSVRMVCDAVKWFGNKGAEAAVQAAAVAGDKAVQAASQVGAPLGQMAKTLEQCACVRVRARRVRDCAPSAPRRALPLSGALTRCMRALAVAPRRYNGVLGTAGVQPRSAEAPTARGPCLPGKAPGAGATQ